MDAVVAEAVGDRLPGADALRETLRRRRASGGPAEQTFATVVGLELRPRRLRAASELWRLLTEQRGVAGRDALWAHPDLVPTADDLDDPAAFVARADGSDPIAELEKLANEEKSAGGDSRRGADDARDERERGFAAKPRSCSAGPVRRPRRRRLRDRVRRRPTDPPGSRSPAPSAG